MRFAPGGRYSPDGEYKERRLVAFSFESDALGKVTASTFGKLQAQRAEQRQALQQPKKPPTDPALALCARHAIVTTCSTPS